MLTLKINLLGNRLFPIMVFTCGRKLSIKFFPWSLKFHSLGRVDVEFSFGVAGFKVGAIFANSKSQGVGIRHLQEGKAPGYSWGKVKGPQKSGRPYLLYLSMYKGCQTVWRW